MLNRVELIGHLGDDPEIKTFADGTKYANLRMATSETWRDKNTGEKREKTEWHRITIFGKLSEVAEKYLKKGSRVFIEGKLTTRKWQDQNGNDRYSTEVQVTGFRGGLLMLDRAGSNNRSDSGQSESRQSSRRESPPQNYDDLDDEIPF